MPHRLRPAYSFHTFSGCSFNDVFTTKFDPRMHSGGIFRGRAEYAMRCWLDKIPCRILCACDPWPNYGLTADKSLVSQRHRAFLLRERVDGGGKTIHGSWVGS